MTQIATSAKKEESIITGRTESVGIDRQLPIWKRTSQEDVANPFSAQQIGRNGDNVSRRRRRDCQLKRKQIVCGGSAENFSNCLGVNAVADDLQSIRRTVDASTRRIIFHTSFSIEFLAVANNFLIVPFDISGESETCE